MGSWAAGGDFDVADFALVSPENDAFISLPFDFCWDTRGIAGDNYGESFDERLVEIDW